MPGNRATIGALFRQYRRAKNITQEEVAGYVDVTKQSISQFERGRGTLSQEKVLKLAEYLGISKLDLAESYLGIDLSPATRNQNERDVKSDEEISAFFHNFRELTSEDRDEVREHIKFVDNLVERKWRKARYERPSSAH